MQLFRFGLVVILLCSTACRTVKQKLDSEKRILIAVGDFQNRSNDRLYDDLTYVSTGNFIFELNRHGVFRIIERERLGNLLDEYRLARTGLLDLSDRNDLGKILGVDAILVVTLTSVQYKISEQNFSTKNIIWKKQTHPPSVIHAISANEELHVLIDARLISIGSGEVIASAKFQGSDENYYSAILGITQNGSQMDKREIVKKMLNDSAPILARDISRQAEENRIQKEN